MADPVEIAAPLPDWAFAVGGTDWVSADVLREAVRARLASRGDPSRFAREAGLCDETVLAFLRGVRDPADELLAALGWERRTFYRCVDPKRLSANDSPLESILEPSVQWENGDGPSHLREATRQHLKDQQQ